MSQQFSIAVIIEFVETLNREVKDNTFFLCNASKFEILLSTNILLALLRGRHAESYDKDYYTQHES